MYCATSGSKIVSKNAISRGLDFGDSYQESGFPHLVFYGNDTQLLKSHQKLQHRRGSGATATRRRASFRGRQVGGAEPAH